MECILGIDLIPSLNRGARYITTRKQFTDNGLIEYKEARIKTIGCMHGMGYYYQPRCPKARGVRRPVHILRGW